MKKALLLTIICIILASSVFAADVENEIEETLETEDEVSVIVVLKDEAKTPVEEITQQVEALDLEPAEEANKIKEEIIEEQKEMVDEQQEEVLSNLDVVDSTEDTEDVDFKIDEKFETINGFAGKVTKEGLEKLKNDPNVLRIHVNRKANIMLDVSVPLINVTNLWNITQNSTFLDGSGESVCVIDTGVNINHQDLAGKVVAEYCYCDNEETDSDGVGCCPNGNITDTNSSDDHSHGTHVVGIIASLNSTYKGTSPGANIVSIKALNGSGSGWFSDIASSIDWCINNASVYNISVITMSLGDGTQNNNPASCDGFLTANAIDNAVAAGITVVVASGNEGYSNGIAYPACASNATSVGATDDSNSVTAFTNSDELLDLLAPGNNIISLSYTGGTTSKSGTSMATPHVAGLAAILNQFSKLNTGSAMNPHTLEETLKSTGRNFTDSKNSLTFPRIESLAALLSIDTYAPSISYIDPTPGNSSLTNQTSIVVNISSSETLSNAIIDWNGTNYSMSKTGANWNYSASGLSGTIYFQVYGNDSAGNSGQTSVQTVTFNNSAPVISAYYPNAVNVTIAQPSNQTFNVTYSDPNGNAVTVTWYFNNTEQTTGFQYNYTGGYTVYGSFNVSVVVSDGGLNTTNSWNFTINKTNRAPNVSTVNITPASPTSSDNLTCSYTFSDPDSDADNSSIEWFMNRVENSSLENQTSIDAQKGQTWHCRVSAYDGFDAGNKLNSSNVTITNSAPSITTIANISSYETYIVNITVSATDADGDSLNYSINNSNFNQSSNVFSWNTSIGDQGTYTVSINVTDGINTTFQDIMITINKYIDTDSDGTPDHNDSDDDNDGLNDTTDFIKGNASNVNSTSNITIYINGSNNLSQFFNGTANVNITNGSTTLVSFNFSFSNSTQLNLYNITVQTSVSDGVGSIIIRGVQDSGIIGTKTAYVRDYSTSESYVCIKDAEGGSTSELSADCDGTSEYFVACDGTSTSGYTCNDLGAYYKITNLAHSIVAEKCIDGDDDTYDASYCGGTDCDDSAALTRPGATEVCGDNEDNDCDGTTDEGCSTSTSSSGGGGGGGGSAVSGLGAKESFYYDLITAESTKSMSLDNANIAVTKNTFTVLNVATSVSVSVEVVDSSVVPALSGSVYQYLRIALTNIQSADISSGTIEFKVPKSWLVDYDKSSVVLKHYTDSWKDLDTTLVNQDENYVNYRAQTDSYSYFAITAQALVAEAASVEEAPIVINVPENESSSESSVVTEDSTTIPTRETRAFIADLRVGNYSGNSSDKGFRLNIPDFSKEDIWMITGIIAVIALIIILVNRNAFIATAATVYSGGSAAGFVVGNVGKEIFGGVNSLLSSVSKVIKKQEDAVAGKAKKAKRYFSHEKKELIDDIEEYNEKKGVIDRKKKLDERRAEIEKKQSEEEMRILVGKQNKIKKQLGEERHSRLSKHFKKRKSKSLRDINKQIELIKQGRRHESPRRTQAQIHYHLKKRKYKDRSAVRLPPPPKPED